MKKVPFALVLALGLASGSAFAASSGVINISGEVTGTTCEVAVGDITKNVILAKVGVEAVTPAGKTSPVRFNIALTGCVADSMVSAVFSADAPNLIDTGSGTLVNTETVGPATNVNIALYDDLGEQIELGNQAYVLDTARQVPADGALTLTYAAAYYGMGTVTPGKVKAKANYIIAYQ